MGRSNYSNGNGLLTLGMRMSLTRQFGLGFLSVLVLVFLGTVWINVNSTRSYISDQLTSHSQDTATSLGLSISPYVGMEGGLPVIDTMVNAIFDRGYYESIELKDLDGKLLLKKTNPPKPELVPEWFMQLFPIVSPVTRTEINSGWVMAGELTVKSHPGLGYAQLWSNAKRTFLLTLVIFIIGTLLLGILLKLITNPLKVVIRAAERIASRDFNPIEYEPKTKELNLLVKAFNKMAGILSKQYSELTAQAQAYYKKAYLDPLTQLGNKQALDNKFARIFTKTDEEPVTGFLILVRLSSLAQVNESEGAAIADEYIKNASQILSTNIQQKGELFRSRGADFAILLEDMSDIDCKNILQTLSDQFKANSSEMFINGYAHMGVAHFGADTKKAPLLELTDAALTSAANNPNGWQLASDITVQQSHESWREQLKRIIEDEAIDILLQPVKNFDSSVLFSECLARFKDSTGEKYLPMAQLIPESEKLLVSGELDKAILKKILSLLNSAQTNKKAARISINISTASLGDLSNIDEIIELLKHIRKRSERVIVEIHEHSLHRCFKNCVYFANMLKENGCKITIERFGSSISAFSHIRQIRPDYIKLDGSFTRNINSSEENQFFVSSLVSIAHGLNIEVIAELVEDEDEARCLHGLFVDYVQGYYFGKPEVWS